MLRYEYMLEYTPNIMPMKKHQNDMNSHNKLNLKNSDLGSKGARVVTYDVETSRVEMLFSPLSLSDKS